MQKHCCGCAFALLCRYAKIRIRLVGVLKQNLLPELNQVGTPEGTRTPHLLLRRQLLYPDELLAHMERVMGIEPTPTAWKAVVLAVILHPHIQVQHQP